MSSATIHDALRRGIRPDKGILDASYLRTCKNLRPTPWGLDEFLTVNQPITDAYITGTLGKTKTWPFPQLFIGKQVTLLCFETTIYEITPTQSGTWTVVLPAMTTKHAGNPNATMNLSIPAGGGPWQFVDFWDTWMLFNGKCFVWRTFKDDEPFVCVGTKGLVELLTNPGFITPGSPWVLETGWTYSSGKMTHVSGSESQLYQSRDDFAETICGGCEYTFTIKVDALSGGSLSCGFGLGSFGTVTQTISTTGTHTFRLRCPGNLDRIRVTAPATVYAVIDSLSATSAMPSIETGANWADGRAVLAGFNSSDFYGLVDWPDYLDGVTAEVDSAIRAVMDYAAGAGPNWVWWSTIGGGDLFWLINKSALISPVGSGYTEDNPYIFELLRKNTCGLAPMPWQGRNLCTKQLGHRMVVYGGYDPDTYKSGGIAALANHEGGKIGVDYPLGIAPNVGIASRGAVAGDELEHAFVDESGTLWGLGANLKADNLGYRHLLSSMLDNELVLSFDGQNREFYIADGEVCYLLNKNGLCRAPWLPTTVSFAQGGLAGIKFNDTQDVEIVTGIITNPDSNGISTLKTIQYIGKNPSSLIRIVLLYRLAVSDAWTETVTKTPDMRGITVWNIPAFQWKVKATAASGTNLSASDFSVLFGTDKPNWGPWLAASTPGVGDE